MPSVRVAVCEVEHGVVERVEPRERDELELVAHGAELALELGDRRIVQIALPVERRRAVVGEQLARERRGGSLRRSAVQTRGPALPVSHHTRSAYGGVGESASKSPARCRFSRDRSLPSVRSPVRNGLSFSSTSDVTRRGSFASVRAISTVGTPSTSAASRAAIELLHRFLRGNEHLAAHVAALLHRRQLILEVHACRARFDHRLHELVGVQHAAEARLGVRDDGRETSRSESSPSRRAESGRHAAARC